MTLSSVRGFRRGETVIIGAGEVGQTITSALTNARVPHTVLDQADEPWVDVVGDATDPEELRHAGVGTARTVISPCQRTPIPSSRRGSVISTRTTKSSPAPRKRNVQKMYRAGADYVLALTTVIAGCSPPQFSKTRTLSRWTCKSKSSASPLTASDIRRSARPMSAHGRAVRSSPRA